MFWDAKSLQRQPKWTKMSQTGSIWPKKESSWARSGPIWLFCFVGLTARRRKVATFCPAGLQKRPLPGTGGSKGAPLGSFGHPFGKKKPGPGRPRVSRPQKSAGEGLGVVPLNPRRAKMRQCRAPLKWEMSQLPENPPRKLGLHQKKKAEGPTFVQTGVNPEILVSLEPLVGLWCQRRPQIPVYSTFHKSHFFHDLLAKQAGAEEATT